MKKKSSIFLAGLCCAAVLTGCGNVSQATKTIELGENVTVMDLVDCKEGISASIKDKNALDTMKVGSYDVTFTVKAGDGKTEEKTFTYEVVDTTAPEIVTGDNLTVIKGVDFNIQELIDATDLSGDITITSSVNVDTKTSGEYPITVTAADTYGNKATKDIVVTVLERTETNFRNAVWGDSIEMVRSLETAKEVYSDDSGVIYEGTLCGLDANITYAVDKEYGLYFTCYEITNYYGAGTKYINDYYTLKEELVAKYGKPTTSYEPKKYSWMADYCDDYGQALQLGYVAYASIWETAQKDTKIILITSSNNYDPYTSIGYYDTRYKMDNSSNF